MSATGEASQWAMAAGSLITQAPRRSAPTRASSRLQPAEFLVSIIGSLELFGGPLLAPGLLTRPIALLFSDFTAVATSDDHRSAEYLRMARSFPCLCLRSSFPSPLCLAVGASGPWTASSGASSDGMGPGRARD
ncbi:DoxX family protein [Muricoccus aerilatus]|uniref:DoxX family protein n=1 Tax=Muricoccus aerilatus TaxID=452982 RepID=UPI0009FF7108